MELPWYILLLEVTFVATFLLIVTWSVLTSPIEILGALAVLVAFLHLQVQEEARCYTPKRTSMKFLGLFILREAVWISYFTLLGAYAAVIGAVIFALFPFWRLMLRKIREKFIS